jgi:hypothetical protein
MEIIMTYNELLTEIRRVNCDPLLGAGKFTKEELLADRIIALMNEKVKPKNSTLFLNARGEESYSLEVLGEAAHRKPVHGLPENRETVPEKT